MRPAVTAFAFITLALLSAGPAGARSQFDPPLEIVRSTVALGCEDEDRAGLSFTGVQSLGHAALLKWEAPDGGLELVFYENRKRDILRIDSRRESAGRFTARIGGKLTGNPPAPADILSFFGEPDEDEDARLRYYDSSKGLRWIDFSFAEGKLKEVRWTCSDVWRGVGEGE